MMKAMKILLLISALGVAVFSQDEGVEDDDDYGEEISGSSETTVEPSVVIDSRSRLFSGFEDDDDGDIYGSGETTVEPTTGNDSGSLPSSAAHHSPQRGAVVTKYSLCLFPVILNLCMKA